MALLFLDSIVRSWTQQDAMSSTHGNLGKWLVAKGVVHLILPAAIYPGLDVLFWYILDLGDGVVICVVLENDTKNLVLGASKPAFLEVF